MQAELIYNPSGGQVVVRRELDSVVAYLGRHGWSVAVQETSAPWKAERTYKKRRL
jgi:diacylglycerol kinase family enzyme